jgi:hypothetical protein
MLVLHFGMLHEEDCVELSTTQDWVPFEEFTEEALEGLNIRRCPHCLDE